MIKQYVSTAAIAISVAMMSVSAETAWGKPPPTEDLNENAILSLLTPKTIFVTSDTYTGDLASAALTLGFDVDNGSDAADAICQYHADQAGIKGTYVAIISTSSVDAAAKLSASLGPYRKVNGAPVAENYAALFHTTFGVESDTQIDASPIWLISGVSRDELNTVVTGPFPSTNVWTGTNSVGEISKTGPGGQTDPSRTTCNDWTTDSAANDCIAGPCGTVGQEGRQDPEWLSLEPSSCDEAHLLYCVEL